MTAVNRQRVSSTSPQGVSVASQGSSKGYGLFGSKSVSGTGAYEPSVIALIILILLEFAAYAGLRYTFKSVHGG
jgi:hypothetical protein